MKIVELILDEDQDTIGIDAISIVESPAIESDFVALNQQEIKLAEVDKEKKILLGALLIPNKPIYRNGEEGEYYIFFSKDTIVKASQMYLQNGYQNKSTLEHSKALEGLTLVESWIVEDEVNDKSRKYGLNVPVGTWMGAVKVNNDEVWNEYVKTNKVKGFSIEGYFADKMERPKESVKEDMGKTMELEAAELLSKIESIVKGEKLELALVDNIEKTYNNIKSDSDSLYSTVRKAAQDIDGVSIKAKGILKQIDGTDGDVKKLVEGAKDLGIELPSEASISIRQLQAYRSDLSELVSRTEKASDGLFAMLG
jgi:hypothetical protein